MASKRASIIYPNCLGRRRLFIHVGMSSRMRPYRPITLSHASPFRQGERRTCEERDGKNRQNRKGEKKRNEESIYLFHARARTCTDMYAFRNATPHACTRARTSPTQTPLSTRPEQERVRPHTRMHARMQTHAPFGEDKTGRKKRGRVGGWE